MSPHQRGDAAFEMSSTALKEFAKCPSRWIAGYYPPSSSAMQFGSLLDCLLLTPSQFKDRYAVRPDTYRDDKGAEKPWHHASNHCKAWLVENEDKEIVSTADLKDAQAARDRLLADPVILDFVMESDKQVWIAGEWQCDNGFTFPVKCLIDLLPRNDSEFYKTVADLKTTRNAALIPWQRQVFDNGYHTQGAFNFDMVRAALPDEDRCNFAHIVVENFAPWQTGKRILSESFIELGRAQYVSALNAYGACLQTGVWPGYDDSDESSGGWSVTEPTPWMENAFMFAPKFKTEVPPQPESEDVTP